MKLDEICNLSFYSTTDDNNVILNLCRNASKDVSVSCALNAINEEAVNSFLRGNISFLDIERVVLEGIEKFVPINVSSLENIVESDRIGRKIAKGVLSERF